MPIVIEWGPSQANAMQLGASAGQNIEQFARSLQTAQFLQQARQQAGELQLGQNQLAQQESQFSRTLPLQERGVQVQERGATVNEQLAALEQQRLAQQQQQFNLQLLYQQDQAWRQQQAAMQEMELRRQLAAMSQPNAPVYQTAPRGIAQRFLR